MSVSTDPFVLSVSPFKTIVSAGQHEVTVHVTVKDAGTQPLKVTSNFQQVQALGGGRFTTVKAPASWAQASPASFSLAPGQAKSVLVTVHVPDSVTGKTDIAAMFRGQLPHSDGNLAVSGQVGSQVVLSLPGQTQTLHPSVSASPPPAAASGSSWPGALAGAGIILAVVLVALAVWAIVLRRRHHSRQQAS